MVLIPAVVDDSSRQDGLIEDLRLSKSWANGLGGFTKGIVWRYHGSW
jgi:hypothetical protein